MSRFYECLSHQCRNQSEDLSPTNLKSTPYLIIHRAPGETVIVLSPFIRFATQTTTKDTSRAYMTSLLGECDLYTSGPFKALPPTHFLRHLDNCSQTTDQLLALKDINKYGAKMVLDKLTVTFGMDSDDDDLGLPKPNSRKRKARQSPQPLVSPGLGTPLSESTSLIGKSERFWRRSTPANSLS